MNSYAQAFANTTFAYLIGPTCVGKGFILKLFDRAVPGCVAQGLMTDKISFGQIIRDLIELDADFERKHKPTIKAGNLLDDPDAINIFDGKLSELSKEGPYDLILVDGFGRSKQQITHAANLGLLRKQDHVFDIEASFAVCADRFTHRNQQDPTRMEREFPTFEKRYHLHSDNVGDLIRTFQQTEARGNIRRIDANLSIPEYAFPAFISHLMPIIANIMAAKSTKEISAA